MTALTPQSQASFAMAEVASLFIELHLDTVAKRDLTIWFVRHPEIQFALSELGQALGHNRKVIMAGLRALQETSAITSAHVGGSTVWQLTSDIMTRRILQAVERYFREHPGARTIIVRHQSKSVA